LGIDFGSVDLLQAALRRSTEKLSSPADQIWHGINQIAIHLMEGSASMQMDHRIREYQRRSTSRRLTLEHQNLLAETEERLRELGLDIPLHGMVASVLYMARTGKLDDENVDDLAEAILLGLNRQQA
jgi:hypothetical protein